MRECEGTGWTPSAALEAGIAGDTTRSGTAHTLARNFTTVFCTRNPCSGLKKVKLFILGHIVGLFQSATDRAVGPGLLFFESAVGLSSGPGPALNQFHNGLCTPHHHRQRPALGPRQLELQVDTQQAIDGGCHLGRVYGTVLRRGAYFV